MKPLYALHPFLHITELATNACDRLEMMLASVLEYHINQARAKKRPLVRGLELRWFFMRRRRGHNQT
jgi:hypothetical protein